MNKALETTANVLAVTSNLLAIGIEVGIIAGGYFLYKKYLAEPKQDGKSATVKVLASEDETDISEQKPTVKDKLRKAGRILKAVLA